MLKKLKKYIITLNFFNERKEELLPDKFSDSEKIVRSIFSPINVGKDGQKIKANAFRTPAGIDEVSVNRLSYTTEDFCKEHSKKIQKPESRRSYFGLALLYSNEINDCNCNLIYTPKKDNIFHSDIKTGYTLVKGQPLEGEIQQKIKNLANKARLFKDPNPNSLYWEGDSVE